MEPIIKEPALYISSPIMAACDWMPGGVMHVDCRPHLQEIRAAREWYEPIEDEV